MKSTRIWHLVVAVLAVCAVAGAQTYQGRISGTVTDQSGAVVRGAKVTVTNTDTGATRDLVTNEAGDWVAPNLPPGPYNITIEAPNFKRVQRTGLRLEVAKDVHLDTALQPGARSEVVEVTGEAPLVETTNDTLGGTFSNRTINDLPLNGRDFQNLLVLRPGVQRSSGGGFLSISSNGNRPEDNNFIMDGTDNNDPYYATTVINAEGVQGTPGTVLPIDAIQEFNAQENPPAEYGWKPGAIVNIGLKSGTNTLHGSAYLFERNSALDARNKFAAPEPAPHTPLRQHQFGASIGGPIIKNKTFFFGAYEGVRALITNNGSVFMPVTDPIPGGGGSGCNFGGTGDCVNSIPDATADLALGGFPVNPLSANLLGTGAFAGNGPYPGLFPVNTDPSGNLITAFSNTNRMDDFIVKIDHHLSEHHSLTARYFFGDSLQKEEDVPVVRQQWLSTSQLRAQVLGVNWTWTPNARWVNEAKFGWNRFWQIISVADSNLDPATAYGINTGVTAPVDFGMPRIRIDGFNGRTLGGNSSWPLQTIPNQTFQVVDNISWTHGRHTVRFGGEYRHGSTHNRRDRYGKGQIRFTGGGLSAFCGCFPAGVDSTPLEDFLAGFPATGTVFTGNSERFVSLNSFGAFVQDDFRVSPRLTVNFGVRYDLNTVIKEKHNLLGNWEPSVGLEQVGVNVGSPYNGDHNNFAPRLGIAWDMFGSGKTVLRAGGGLTYEIPHIAVFIGQNGNNQDTSTTGLNQIPTGLPGSNLFGNGGTITAAISRGFPVNWTVAGPVLSGSVDCSVTPCDIAPVDRNLRTPYVWNWNINIQQSFGKTSSLQVGYVGVAGRKLYSLIDINQVDSTNPNEIACGHCEQAGRPFNAAFPYLGFINFIGNSYGSSYNGLQTTFTTRGWNGLSLVAGYTYAHIIDNASLNRAAQPQDSTRPGLERGNSDLDIRHRFTLSMTYELPNKKSFAQMLEGWQVNSIVTLQTGQPWTAYDYDDDITLTGEFSDRWNFEGDPHLFKPDPFNGIPYSDDCSTFGSGIPTLAAGVPCYHVPGATLYLPPLLNPADPASARAFGTAGRNIFPGPSYKNWDFSVTKTWNLTERFNMQFRAEFFNILNHPNFANPQSALLAFAANDSSIGNGGVFGANNLTPDFAAANPVIGTGGPRAIQLGLKFRF